MYVYSVYFRNKTQVREIVVRNALESDVGTVSDKAQVSAAEVLTEDGERENE